MTARGNRRTSLFHNREDYLTYLNLLLEVKEMAPFILHSYCLMTNHIHLQLETTTHHIKVIMKELHSKYAVYFNKKYNYIGHVFQGRYGAELIEDDHYFLEVSRYIHRNPLEASMVECLSSYEWSSYPAYVNLTENQYVYLQRTLHYFPDPKFQNYKRFVEKTTLQDKEIETWLQKS
ncbi:transposase [Bacillus sp. Marseille-P3661]|uniref:transposase n=1 Tax=Bacillus sp. Marseille-P3661 TaxID=1936234 RepID=UPI0021555498|nr:transposase [Bacillus sp. Marseille-P3661]